MTEEQMFEMLAKTDLETDQDKQDNHLLPVQPSTTPPLRTSPLAQRVTQNNTNNLPNQTLPSVGETKTTTPSHTTTTTSHYGNALICPTHLTQHDIFRSSVDLSKQGIQRNQYDHHTDGDASRPECLHEIVQPWEAGWNPFDGGWSTRTKWTCDACQKDLTKERWAKEKELFDAVRVEDTARSIEEHASLLHGLAIRLDVLLLFTFLHNCWEWPTWRVVRDIVKPATSATRCRYGELPEMKGKPWFGPADVFMS